jgi:protocatechuate 3,4-dioxygenase beta subunit
MTGGATLILTVLLAQAPARDAAAPAKAGTGTISGTVASDAQPSRPIRRAVVTLNAPENSIARTTVTDDAGRFSFAELPAGRYAIGASKPGWVGVFYGAKRAGRPGTPLSLEDGQRATVTMRLPRTAVITGVVLDSRGQPLPLAIVRALRYGIVNGERRLIGTGITRGPDERGVYRIYGLSAGEYLVSASTRSNPFSETRPLHLTTDVDVQQAMAAIQAPGPSPIDTAAERLVGFAPTYYPGTASSAQAALIRVAAGEERAGVDFGVMLVPALRVEGTVAGPDGVAHPGTQVNLVGEDAHGASAFGIDSIRTARVGEGGRFRFADVTPGTYTVAARVGIAQPGTVASPGAVSVLWATSEITVQGESITNVSLEMQPGLSVSGAVRFDGASPPLNLSAARVTTTSIGSTGQVTVGTTAAQVAPDGRFTIASVSPGRYRINVNLPNAGNWVYRSTAIAGQDTRDAPIDIRASMSDVVVTFVDRGSELSGKVQAPAGAPPPDCYVILYSVDRTAWYGQSRRILSSRPASDGAYTMRNVIPGEYFLAAVEDVESGEWFDPEFLQRILPTTTRITIGDGEKKLQDLKVGGG